jgi:hypothetical protein
MKAAQSLVNARLIKSLLSKQLCPEKKGKHKKNDKDKEEDLGDARSAFRDACKSEKAGNSRH